jgi:hypothetical protein
MLVVVRANRRNVRSMEGQEAGRNRAGPSWSFGVTNWTDDYLLPAGKHFGAGLRLYKQDHSRGGRLTTTGQPTVSLLPLLPSRNSRVEGLKCAWLRCGCARPTQNAHGLAIRYGGAVRWQITRHWRNFLKRKSGYKHGLGSNASPAIQFPFCSKELYLWSLGDVQNHFTVALIKLLRELQERLLAKVLPVGGAPDGNVEGFLLELVRDGEDAEECAGGGFGNVERRPGGVGFEFAAGRDECKFE